MSTENSTRPEKYPWGKHPNSQKNLKPYPKGTNGHTGGYSLKERLMHSLDKPLAVPGEKACAGDRIVYSTLEGALLREPTPFKEVWDRTDGKVPQALTGPNNGPLELLVRWDGNRNEPDNTPETASS